MTDTVDLSFDSYGDENASQCLVIAHGLFGSSTNWRAVGKKLGEQFRVLVVDMRNHGESPWSDRHDYSAMASDLGQFIETKTTRPCVLVGHSMGGKAAMTLALSEPRTVAGIVIVDIAPVTYGHTHAGFIEAMRDTNLDNVASRADANAALETSIPEAPVRQFLLQNLVREDSGYRWRINLEALDKNMPHLIDFDSSDSTSTAPALFLYGTASGYVDTAARQRAAERFPKSEFIGVEGAGHWVHAEQPRAVIQAISEFTTARA